MCNIGTNGTFSNLNSSSSVVSCNGYYSCKSSKFVNVSISRLNCYGAWSCVSIILNTRVSMMTCHGRDSCSQAQISGVQQLWLTGFNAGYSATFSSPGDANDATSMVVVIIGKYAGASCTFNCLASDTCIFYFFNDTSFSMYEDEANRTFKCDESATCIHRTFESSEWLDEIANFIGNNNNNISLIRPPYESFNHSNKYESNNNNNNGEGLQWWGILLIVIGLVVVSVIGTVVVKKRRSRTNKDKYQMMSEK